MSTPSLKGFFKANTHLTKADRKLFEGIADDNADLIRAAIGDAANVNVRIIDGYTRDKTALMLACESPNSECVRVPEVIANRAQSKQRGLNSP